MPNNAKLTLENSQCHALVPKAVPVPVVVDVENPAMVPAPAPAPVPVAGSASASTSAKFEVECCRICGDSEGELYKLCACNSKVHRACQQRWLVTRSDGSIPTLSGGAFKCEVCGSQVDIQLPKWYACFRISGSLEGCALLLLSALAAGAHLVYLAALRRVSVAIPVQPRHALPALASRNALATALLLALSARGAAYVLRDRNPRPPLGAIVAAGGAASLAAGALVLALAAP